jgi:hypothetical protein
VGTAATTIVTSLAMPPTGSPPPDTNAVFVTAAGRTAVPSVNGRTVMVIGKADPPGAMPLMTLELVHPT